MATMKLSRKIFAWLVIIALTPTLLISFLYLNSFKNTFLAQEKQQLSHLTDRKTAQIESYINERINDILLLSKINANIHRLNTLNISKKTAENKIVQNTPYQQNFSLFETMGYPEIHFISPNEKTLIQANQNNTLNTYRQKHIQENNLRQAFQEAISTQKPIISNLEMGKSTDEASAFITNPIYKENQLLGVIALKINFQEIQKIITEKSHIHSRKATLISLVNNEITYQSPSSVNPNIKTDQEKTIYKLPLSMISPSTELKYSTIIETASHTSDIIVAYQKIPSTNWILILEENYHEAMRPIEKLIALSITIFFMLFISIIILAVYLGRTISNPIVSMTKVTRAIAEGNFNLKVELIGFQENIDLANSINKMSKHLEKTKTSLEQEVTKRTHELQEISTRLQKISERLPGMIYQFELKPDGKMSFPYVSGSIKDIYGITPKELKNDVTKAFTVIHPDDLEGINTSIKISADTQMPWRKEYRIYDTDGSIRWLFGNSTPEKTADGSILWHGFVTDITERKNMEEQLRRSQKMEALGKLTSGIAHDYNNMLGIILGYADLLALKLNDKEQLKNYVHEIHKAGERGAKLTQKLLAFSRQKSINPEVLDVNTILLDSQNMLEKILTARIKLSIVPTDNLWPVFLDKGELEDTLLNMAINAMHAMSDYGQLTIQTSNISIDEMSASQLQITAGDYVLLSIKDTGSGMKKQTLERIFDPFYSTKGERGTGLGLSQVYGFIERSNSAIKVHSIIGEGTEFKLYFLRHTNKLNDVKRIKNTKPSDLSGKESILVVDDEAVLLNICNETLTQQGYKTFCTQSAKEALTILENETIDLLLTDVIMPEMDGYELASIVQKKYPSIKIQLVSGFSDERNARNVDQNLRNNILHKPYTLKALLTNVKHLLQS